MEVTGLFMYPLKGGKGIPLTAAELDNYGIRHDRRFMVIDPKTNSFITQRQNALLSQVCSNINETDGTITFSMAKNSNGKIKVPLKPTGGVKVDAKVWGEPWPAYDCGDAAAVWFSQALGEDARLVACGDDYTRVINKKYRPGTIDGRIRVGFADGFPLLVTTEESLAKLNADITAGKGRAVPMTRFRPNVVVRGCTQAFEEDSILVFTCGTTEFSVVKPCSRCKVTTIDQDTAEKGAEPLKTLYKTRQFGDKPNRGVYFGVNAIHHRPGVLAVGDKVEVVARRDAPFPAFLSTHRPSNPFFLPLCVAAAAASVTVLASTK